MQLPSNCGITSFIACLPSGFQDEFNPCAAIPIIIGQDRRVLGIFNIECIICLTTFHSWSGQMDLYPKHTTRRWRTQRIIPFTSHVSTHRVANIVLPETGAYTIREKVENDIESSVLGGS